MSDFFSVIIAGSRGLSVQVGRIERELDCFLYEREVEPFEDQILQVVSGGEKTGVDRSGEVFAAVKKHPVRIFPADWDKNGKAAGPKRNEQMAKYADVALIFVKKEPTPGSSNMAMWMLMLDKPVKVVTL